MIVFTSDIDWATEEVIEDTLAIFKSYNVPCTFFCTHQSEVLQNCDRSLFELGIHPNFNPSLLNGEPLKAQQTVKDIYALYPEARGIRSHSLTQSTMMQGIYKEEGLAYESNQLYPYNYDVKPFLCWTGLTRIPFSWEDDIHFAYKKSFDYDILAHYSAEKTLVMDFHPIHIFLNTDCAETYQKAKPFYHQTDELVKLRNSKVIGTRDFLISVLEGVRKRKLQTRKAIDLVVEKQKG